MEDLFLKALHNKKMVEVSYFSKKDNRTVTRRCAPLDIGRHKKYPHKGDYYFFWDFDGSTGPHVVSKKPSEIIQIDILDESFSPEDFVSWVPDWNVDRNW